MSCCNNIYPESDLRRWESCDSVQLANADNFYSKKEVDDLLDDIVVSGDGITADEAQDLIDSSLEDYYDKDEIDAAFDTVNNELANKLDASAYTPTDLSGYYTKSQVDALIEALQAQIDDLSDCCSGSGDTGSTEGMKWVLHMNNGQSASLICDAPNDQLPHQIDDDEFVHTHRVFNTSDELSSITSAYVGECVYGIMDNGFSGCTNMSSITVSNNLAYIGANAFRGCENLENFPYSSGLEVISGSAFAHCYSLTHANIPSGVTSIGSWAFQDCTGLTQVVVEGTTPPTLGNWAFYNEYGTAQLDITIYVPSSAENTYKTAAGWSEYASRIQAIP